MKHHHLTAQSRITTPLGRMTAAASEHGLAGLWFDDQRHHPGPLAVPTEPGQRWLQAAAAALTAYFERGQWPTHLALDLSAGTPFQQAVWRALLALAPGRTSTDTGLRPTAAPAARTAAGRPACRAMLP